MADSATLQRNADILGQGINLNNMHTWAMNLEMAASTARRDNRPSEAAFWAKAYADVLDGIAEATGGENARRLISVLQDRFAMRASTLRWDIRTDEERTPGPANKISQNTLVNMRKNAIKCFGGYL